MKDREVLHGTVCHRVADMASTSNATGLGSPDGLGAGLVAVVIGSVAFVMLACVGVCCWTAYQQRKKAEEQRLAEEAKERRELRRASAEAGDIGRGGRSVVVPVDAVRRGDRGTARERKRDERGPNGGSGRGQFTGKGGSGRAAAKHTHQHGARGGGGGANSSSDDESDATISDVSGAGALDDLSISIASSSYTGGSTDASGGSGSPSSSSFGACSPPHTPGTPKQTWGSGGDSDVSDGGSPNPCGACGMAGACGCEAAMMDALDDSARADARRRDDADHSDATSADTEQDSDGDSDNDGGKDGGGSAREPDASPVWVVTPGPSPPGAKRGDASSTSTGATATTTAAAAATTAAATTAAAAATISASAAGAAGANSVAGSSAAAGSGAAAPSDSSVTTFRDSVARTETKEVNDDKASRLPSNNPDLDLLEDEEGSMGLCAICTEGIFPEEEKTSRLPCKHIYHTECVFPWVSKHANCPMCRHEFDATIDIAYSSPGGQGAMGYVLVSKTDLFLSDIEMNMCVDAGPSPMGGSGPQGGLSSSSSSPAFASTNGGGGGGDNGDNDGGHVEDGNDEDDRPIDSQLQAGVSCLSEIELLALGRRAHHRRKRNTAQQQQQTPRTTLEDAKKEEKRKNDAERQAAAARARVGSMALAFTSVDGDDNYELPSPGHLNRCVSHLSFDFREEEAEAIMDKDGVGREKGREGGKEGWEKRCERGGYR